MDKWVSICKTTIGKSHDCNITSYEDGKLTKVTVKAKIVTVPNYDYPLWLHKNLRDSKGWIVTESRTGLTISTVTWPTSKTTQKEAIASAIDKMNKYGKDLFEGLVQNALDSNPEFYSQVLIKESY